MTEGELCSLKPGQIIRNKRDKLTYIVIEDFVAIRVAQLNNSLDWEKLDAQGNSTPPNTAKRGRVKAKANG